MKHRYGRWLALAHLLMLGGTRLVIESNWSPASPREDVDEMGAILDLVRIEP